MCAQVRKAERSRTRQTDAIRMCTPFDTPFSSQDVRILREEAKKLFDQLEIYDGRLERLQHDELLPQLGEAGQADIKAKCTLIRQLLDNMTINVAPVRAPEQLRDYNKALAALDSMRQELGAAGAAADVASVQHCLQQITLNANACEPEPVGPINYKYQGAVLGCTKDDQKQLRKQWRALKEQAERALARAQEESAASGSTALPAPAAAAPPPVPPVRAPSQDTTAAAAHSGTPSGSPIPIDSEADEGTPVSRGGGSTPHSSASTAHYPRQGAQGMNSGVGAAHNQQASRRHIPQRAQQRQRRHPDSLRSMLGGLAYGDGFEQPDPQEAYRMEQERRLREEQQRRAYLQQQARARQQYEAQQRARRGGAGLFDDGWGNAFGGSFW